MRFLRDILSVATFVLCFLGFVLGYLNTLALYPHPDAVPDPPADCEDLRRVLSLLDVRKIQEAADAIRSAAGNVHPSPSWWDVASTVMMWAMFQLMIMLYAGAWYHRADRAAQ